MASKLSASTHSVLNAKTNVGKSPPANKVPLVWGQWPPRNVPLTIVDMKGVFSFYRPFACGEWNAIQVVPWLERENPQAARLVVGVDRVSLPAKHATTLAPAVGAKHRTQTMPKKS